MIFRKWRSKANGKQESLTSSVPQSSGYEHPYSHSLAVHYEDRPPFSILTAETMLFDPKVTIALAIQNGLLANAQVELSDGRPEVMEFVAAQWEHLWSAHAEQILATKNWGYNAAEVMYRRAPGQSRWSGRIIIDGLKDFHPRDVRPLVKDSKIVGITVRNVRTLSKQMDRIEGLVGSDVQGGGKISIYGPKALWLTYGMRYGNLFGQSLLEHAYPPWHEKHQRGGAIKLRKLRMIKDAWVGDQFKFPSKWSQRLPSGELLSGRDLAREIGENRASGGIVGIPSDRDESGNPLFEYVPPTGVQGASDIFKYTDELDTEILEALKTPGEVLEAMSSGSGYSGRKVPFVALLAMLQTEFASYVRQIDEQILRPLVKLNYAVEPHYDIQPKSLIDIITALMGEGQPAGDASQHATAQGGSAMQPMPPQVQQFSDGGEVPLKHVVIRKAHSPRFTGGLLAPRHGTSIGGLYYEEGSRIPADVWQFASDEERERVPGLKQLADLPLERLEGRVGLMARMTEAWQFDDAGTWITIGGREEGQKKHKGGFPVKIDKDGKILSGGPRGLRGKHVSQVKDHFDEQRGDRERGSEPSRKSDSERDTAVVNIPFSKRRGNLDHEIDRNLKRQATEKRQAEKDRSRKRKSAREESKYLADKYLGDMVEHYAKSPKMAGAKKSDIKSTLDSMAKWEPEKFNSFVAKWLEETGGDESPPADSQGPQPEPQKAPAKPMRQRYSKRDHAILRGALGDVSQEDYGYLQPYIDQAHEMAKEEYQAVHGALKSTIGDKYLAAWRHTARMTLNPRARGKDPGDASNIKGFDLLLDHVRRESPGAMGAVAGGDDEESALLHWLAYDSTAKPPKRNGDRVQELLASHPDVQAYLEMRDAPMTDRDDYEPMDPEEDLQFADEDEDAEMTDEEADRLINEWIQEHTQGQDRQK